MASTTELVRIHYRRLPDRENIFTQRLVERTSSCVITFLEHSPLAKPVLIGGDAALETGAPAIWFTFPGQWYDIGRFHRADGSFTGVYTNILTPVHFLDSRSWETTDLFLDLWNPPAGPVQLLDDDELGDALRSGWISADLAAAARREADRLLVESAAGRWPPAVVQEWTLERVRGTLAARQ